MSDRSVSSFQECEAEIVKRHAANFSVQIIIQGLHMS